MHANYGIKYTNTNRYNLYLQLAQVLPRDIDMQTINYKPI